MKISPKVQHTIFHLSALLILFAAAIWSFDAAVARYTMIVGVVGFAATTFTTPYPGKSIRGKRLFNIRIFAVLLMAASAYLLFKNISGWVVTMLIAALLTLYSVIAMSIAYKNETKDKDD
jgi:phosphatidylglycerophosphate synthase